MREGVQQSKSNSVSFVGFCPRNSFSKTAVHFYPSVGAVRAPYNVRLVLTLFDSRDNSRTITLDGARVSHPDGVLLEALFPQGLENASSNGASESTPSVRISGQAAKLGDYYGILVELTAQEAKARLEPSSCVIEIGALDRSVRYRAHQLGAQLGDGGSLAMFDETTTTSLIAINCSESVYTLSLDSLLPDCCDPNTSGRAFDLQPGEVEEIGLASQVGEYINDTTVQVWGQGKSAVCVGVQRSESIPAGVHLFQITRDGQNRRLTSVSRL